MTYQVTYRADAWVRAESGTPEWRQVVIVDHDDGAQLVVVVVRGVLGAPPRVAEARIEQAYITRTAGRKRRTVQGCECRRSSWSARLKRKGLKRPAPSRQYGDGENPLNDEWACALAERDGTISAAAIG